VQILCTLGMIGVDEKITDEAMLAYDRVFAFAIPADILAAIAAIVDSKLPVNPYAPLSDVLPAGSLVET
jgi:hypothetical protein